MKNKHKILVVDDEKNLRESIEMLLRDQYQVFLAGSGREALNILRRKAIDLVLLDIRLPEADGIEVLKQIKRLDPSVEVVMVTAVITVGRAVEAIRLGAHDYITKPFDIAALSELVQKVMEKRALLQENYSLRKLIEEGHQFEKIIGHSPAIREIFKTIEAVAASPTTVLITGESGTGKELVARAIHNRSPRKDKFFVAVNCAAIPEHLLESELFGHEKGAFTGALERQLGKFEIASDGTLFLDEIGALPLPMQAKLLRAVQQKEIERVGGRQPIAVDVRILAATNSDLALAVKEKRFREDLFYRLHVVPITLPPLRERIEDIPLLADHFIRKYNSEFGKKIKGINHAALELLKKYDWPGNVRELENLIERLVVLTKGEFIETEHLPAEIKGKDEPKTTRSVNLKEALIRFESSFISQAIAKAGGRKGEAAKILGIHRNTLRNRQKKLKIEGNTPRIIH